jgi:hypothetical protein
MIEGAAALKPDGNLLQVFRTKTGKIYQSQSMDGGLTWTTGSSAGLPNPGSKVNMLRLSTGEIALAYNNNADARNKLTVALSGDGNHWYNIAEIEGTTAGYMYGVRARCRLIALPRLRLRHHPCAQSVSMEAMWGVSASHRPRADLREPNAGEKANRCEHS